MIKKNKIPEKRELRLSDFDCAVFELGLMMAFGEKLYVKFKDRMRVSMKDFMNDMQGISQQITAEEMGFA